MGDPRHTATMGESEVYPTVMTKEAKREKRANYGGDDFKLLEGAEAIHVGRRKIGKIDIYCRFLLQIKMGSLGMREHPSWRHLPGPRLPTSARLHARIGNCFGYGYRRPRG